MQKVNLLTSHYQCGNEERQKEIDFCFETNKDSGYFSQVINFIGRPTYNDFFKKTLEYPEDINIIANSDIYFNDTIKEVQIMNPNECYALTRWELEGDKVVSFDNKHAYNKEAKARHSQDVWIFNGVAKNISGNFNLGIPGCDNRIAHEIWKAGYDIINPSNRIQCIHKHEDSKRSYNIPIGHTGKISPPYKWVNVEETTKTRSAI
jgi:hypothetical protein